MAAITRLRPAIFLGILTVLTISAGTLFTLQLTDRPSLRAQLDGGEDVPAEGEDPVEDVETINPTSNEVNLLFRPHCEEENPAACDPFDAEDPLTLVTPSLAEQETLDVDVVIVNDARYPITKARTWVTYDPAVLEGTSISIGTDLPVHTPGEADFNKENGYVMIETETEDTEGVNAEFIMVARLQFLITGTPEGGRSILSFYDSDGDEPHTFVQTAPPLSLNVLTKPTGSLTVLVNEAGAEGDEEEPEETVEEHSSSSFSSSSQAAEAEPEETMDEDVPTEDEPMHPAGERTSFVLMQVQNVRVTTERTSLYVAWDALASPDIRGYHVYYGTRMGQYIQRRTVRPEQTALSVLSLVNGTTYYVAVRGFNEQNEETAFSQEASVTIGNPGSSTAPLRSIGGISGDGNPLSGNATGGNQVSVPGASGPATTAAIVLAASALIGTLYAFRRQCALPTHA